MSSVIRFYGHTQPDQLGRYFSNFSKHSVTIDGVFYQTSEHFFQAAKFFKTDPAYASQISLCRSPAEAKKLGSSREHVLDPDWENIKDTVMRKVIYEKVRVHPDVRLALFQTGTITLEEAAPDDYYWGTGRNGTGKNMLGKILMEVRAVLR